MKRIDDRTTLAVAITLTIIAAVAIQFGWRFSELHHTAWAGMSYFFQANRAKVVEEFPLLETFIRPAGEVTILVPHGPADRSGLERGDLVTSVDGIPIEEIDHLENLRRELKPGDTVEYLVRRKGETLSIQVELSSITKNHLQMTSMVSSLVAGLGFVLISILLFAAGPRSHGALLFFFLCVVGSLFFFFSAAFEFELNDSSGIVPVGSQIGVLLTLLVYLVLAVLWSNLLLHFSLVFPRKRPILERAPAARWWLHLGPFALPLAVAATLLILEASARKFHPVILGSVALLAVVAAMKLRQKARLLTGWRSALIESPLLSWLILDIAILATFILTRWILGTRAFLVVFLTVYFIAMVSLLVWPAIYVFLSVANFYRSYKESNAEEKRQLRWPLWGTITSLLLVGVMTILVVIGLFMKPPLHMTMPSLYVVLGALVKLGHLAIPISFGFGIQKYGLMQINTILKKTFVYATVTSVVVITYLIVVGVFGVAFVSFAGVESQSVTVAATLIVAALFIPVRNRVQTFVDGRFFKRQSDYEDVRRSLARMTATSRDLDQFLETAVRVLSEALGVGRLAVFCREPSGTSLRLRKSRGVSDGSVAGLRIEAGDPIAQPGRRIVDLHEQSSGAGAPLDARYAVRLQTAEGVVGALLLSDRVRDRLSEDDLEFLGGIADQLALGISSLQIRTDDLELVQARQIQRSLLPAEIPQIRGVRIATAWIPARSVGGDYYDVISLSDSKVGFCIGDVVGKGMPAALLMSGLQSAVRAFAPADSGTDVTVASVRRVASQNLTGGKFITFFYATIDSSRMLRFTNAGHNEPLLVRSDGSVAHLSSRGTAIAKMMNGAELSGESMEIGRGDTIVLFTDGVTEAPRKGSNDPEEIYGEGRLEDLVKSNRTREPEDLIGVILDDVREFAGGEFADDLTLVVVRAT